MIRTIILLESYFFTRFLEEMPRGGQIGFKYIYDASKSGVLFGFFDSLLIFICEILYFHWQKRKQQKRCALRGGKPKKRVHFLH